VRLAEFDLPTRDPATADYRQRVEDWHDAIAEVWAETIAAHPGAERAGLLVWGDPSLYDSTLRIAARLNPAPRIEVVPGITSLQALTAAHAIPLNEIGAPFQVTTGRRLRAEGWPPGVATVAVMLDGGCAFEVLPGADYDIWWGAYVGMAEEITCAGRLDEVAGRIAEMRAEARAAHGWIMDIYVLRRR
jgi:precorrin-6A synthase